jgi:RimJ/RimL family protein N-acetyltransferase
MSTEKLYLRKSTLEDCEIFAKWEKMPTVTKFFTIDEDRDYQQVKTEFESRLGDQCHEQFTICLKESNTPIGRIHIGNINRHYDSLDITRIYIADVDNRGKGYGEEALKLTLKWAFEEMNMERVTLDHFSGNKIAASLYEKIGFKREGNMRHSGKKNGEYVDLHLMSMLSQEYFQLFN